MPPDRTPDPQDGRIAMIEITPKGQDVPARVRAARRELLAEAFGATSAKEIEQVAATLLRVQEFMLSSAAAMTADSD